MNSKKKQNEFMKNDWKKYLNNNVVKLSVFIKWYIDCDDKSEESYNSVCKSQTDTTYETAMNWLQREDVQKALREYLKERQTVQILNLYQAMYNKALKGDKNCADWCINFYKGDFFNEKSDEMDDYLSEIDIPALRK